MQSSLNMNFKKLSNYGDYFTKEQAIFYDSLKSQISCMKQQTIVNTSGDFTMSLWNIVDNHESIERRQHQLKIEDTLVHAEIKKRIENLKELCYNILSPKTLKEKFNKFWHSPIGTLDQLRVEFENDFLCKRHFQITKDHCQLDCMIILHTQKCNESDKLEKMRFLEKSLDSDLPTQRAEDVGTYSSQVILDSLQDQINQNEVKDLGSFVIICNPNAGYYEFGCFDRTLIDWFQSKEINVFLWNYRDFGRSSGTLSMKNMLSDGHEIIDLVRNKIGARNIALYGKSLGGYVAVNLVDHVELVIADRTFSSISFIPRMMMSKWIQRIFDYYIDNSKINLNHFVLSETPKIILHDSTDEIISQLSSLSTGVTNELAKLYQKKEQNIENDISKKHSSYEKNNTKKGPLRFLNNCMSAISKTVRNDNFNINNEYYKQMITNMDLTSLIIPNQDLWILFLAFKRVINTVMEISNANNYDGKTFPTAHISVFSEEEIDVDGLATNFTVKDDKEIFENIDGKVLSSIHNDPYEDQASAKIKENIVQKNYEYITKICFDDISPELFRALTDIMPAIDNIESCSTTVSDIFVYNSTKYQFISFKILILNMIFWGSYQPMTAILNASSDTRDPKFSFSQNRAKLSDTKKKLETLGKKIKKEHISPPKNKPKPSESNKEFLLALIHDISMIVDRITIIETGLGFLFKRLFEPNQEPSFDSNASTQYTSPNKSSAFMNDEANTTTFENPILSLNNSFNTDQNMIKKPRVDNKAYEKFFGIKKKLNLIPVKVGHNNNLSDAELAMLGKTLYLHCFTLNCSISGENVDNEENVPEFSINEEEDQETNIEIMESK